MTESRQPLREDRAQGKAPSRSHLGASVTSLVTAFTKGMADVMKPYDLRPMEFNLLSHCLKREECNATELAEVLPVDASRISRIVTRLVERGLVVRHRMPSDRRVVTLRLSREGAALVSLLLQRVNDYVATMAGTIDEEEMSTFESVASRIVANHENLKSAR